MVSAVSTRHPARAPRAPAARSQRRRTHDHVCAGDVLVARLQATGKFTFESEIIEESEDEVR